MQHTDEPSTDAAEKQAPLEHMTKLDAALEWARRGFYVFPCLANKSPAVKAGCWAATRDEDKIKEWWKARPDLEIAVHPGLSGHFVIDIDPPNGELTLASLPDLPDTFETKTPRGGRHIWFQGQAASRTKALGEGVDIRGHGGYVLVPPSVGGLYLVSVDAPICETPSWVTEALARKPPETQNAISAPPPEEVIKDALKYCNPSADRDTWRNTIAALRSAGEFQEFALAWSRGEYHGKVPHNYTGDEDVLAVWDTMPPTQGGVTIGTLFHYARQGGFRGNLSTESSIKPKLFPGPVTFATVLSKPVEPIHELVTGLIEKGIVTFLSAPGGTHKSRLALQLGLTLSHGKQFFGRVSERASFLYLSYEDSAAEVSRRAHAIADKLQVPGRDAFYWDLQGQDEPLMTVYEDGQIERHAMATHLRRWCRAVPGHKLIAVDSTYNAVRFAGNAKVNESAVMRSIGALQALGDEADASIVMLWHPSQAGIERGDSSGWSVAWHNAPRARLSITEHDDDHYELKVEKRNHGPRGTPIFMRYDNGIMVQSDPYADLMAVIVDLTKKARPTGGRIEPEDWTLRLLDRFAPNGQATRKFLSQSVVAAAQRGLIVPDGAGGFSLAAS